MMIWRALIKVFHFFEIEVRDERDAALLTAFFLAIVFIYFALSYAMGGASG